MNNNDDYWSLEAILWTVKAASALFRNRVLTDRLITATTMNAANPVQSCNVRNIPTPWK